MHDLHLFANVFYLTVAFVFVLCTLAVSSSEEQSAHADMTQTGGIMAHWWHVDATPSTSSERDGSSAGSSGVGKRPRDDNRTYVTVTVLIMHPYLTLDLKLGFHYPSSRPKFTGRVDGP